MTRRVLPLVAAAAALAAPATAAATDRYVAKTGNNANDCLTPATACLTVQTAVGQANDGDVIHVGPGQYVEAISASDNITIRGNRPAAPGGIDLTQDTVIESASNFTARMLKGGTVENIRLVGGSGAAAGPALIATPGGGSGSLSYTIRDSVLIGGANGGAAAPALKVEDGANANVLALVTGSALDVTATASQTVAVVDVDGDNAAVGITRTKIFGSGTDDDTGVEVRAGAIASLVTGAEVGLDGQLARGIRVAGNTSTAGLLRARVAGSLSAIVQAANAETASLIALDSVIGPALGQTGLGVGLAAAAGGTSKADIRQSTIFGNSSPLGALFASSPAGGSSEIKAVNSIVRNFTNSGQPDVGAGNTAKITLTNSLFNTAQGTGEFSAPGSGTNVTGNPGFVDAGSQDFRLTAGSPALDRGDAGVLIANEVDFAGAARNVDSNGDCKVAPDLGAFELQGQSKPCPTPTPSTPTPPATNPVPPVIQKVLPPAPPRASGLRVRRLRNAVQIAFDLSSAAPVRFTLTRELPGLRRGRSCAKPSKALRRRRAKRCTRLQQVGSVAAAGKAGANVLTLRRRVGKGRYRGTLSVTGAAVPLAAKLAV